MATTLANPAASASAAAPAAATATTTPATSTPSATPTTPAAAAPVQDGHQGSGALNSADSIAAMVEAAKAKGFSEDGTRTDPTKPATDTPAAPSAETKPDAPATSETKPAAETTPAATQEETNPYTFERDGFVGAKDLAAQIDANPALVKALPKELRDVIMATARVAERTSKYEQFFASPAEAEITLQAAQEHAGFSEAFSLIASDVEKGTTAFINKLIEASVMRDDDGNPLKYENGTLKTDGTANRFVETIGKRWMKLNIEKKVKAIADAEVRENVEAALDLVMESVGLRPSTADKTNQDPALAAREAELKRREEALNTERETDRKQKLETFNKSRTAALESVYNDEVGKILKLATGVDKLRMKAIENELESAIRGAIKSNVAYNRRRDNITARPMSEARIKQEAALAREFMLDNLVRIAKPIFADAGIAIDEASKQSAAAQAAREANSRSEVNGGRPATAQSTRTGSTAEEQRAAAAADWKKANPGKEPTADDIRLHQMVMAARKAGFAA